MGIAVASFASGTTIIDNNMIYGVVANSTPGDFSAGLFVGGDTGTGTLGIYFNSVSMTGSRDIGTSTPTRPSFALAIGGANPVVDSRNNILYNTQTTAGTGKSVAIGLAYAAPFNNLLSDYNDMFVSGTSAQFGQIASLAETGTPLANLAAWQLTTGGDANSGSADPVFVSTTNLHLACFSPAPEAGITIPGIMMDIDGDVRPANPSIGADEPVAPQAISVVSRKVQGAGTFDIALPGIESRSGGGGGNYEIVFTFASPVTVANALVTSGNGMVLSASGNGTNTITVDLGSVTDVQCLGVTLACANDGQRSGDVPISMTVLVGDVNANGTVNAGDVALAKSHLGEAANAGNFRADVNANGTVNAGDVALVKFGLGHGGVMCAAKGVCFYNSTVCFGSHVDSDCANCLNTPNNIGFSWKRPNGTCTTTCP